MVAALIDVIVKAVSDHSDIFEYSIDDALTKIHDDIDFHIAVMADNYSEVSDIEYIMVYNGTNCDFTPCNDYTQLVVDTMRTMIDQS